MKAVIFIVLLACAFAGYNPLIVATGEEILKQLTEGNHNHYVLLFYMPAETTSHLGYKNQKTLEDVKKVFLEKNTLDSVFFTTINVAIQNYAKLIDSIGLDVKMLSEGPAILIMEHGNGYIIRGPRTAHSIEKYINEL